MLFALQASGLRLIALTGRPAAWAEQIARMWPVEAAIAENGALSFKRIGAQVHHLDTLDPEARALHRRRLDALVQQAKNELSALVPADDVGGRVSDFTFDIGEHQQAEEETIRAAQGLAHSAGARTTRSSVHLHFTFDRSDKATGALTYLRASGSDPTSALRRFAFIGDSQNDAPAFAAFHTTCGVQNLSGHFSIPPRYITHLSASAGFCAFGQRLIELRKP
jgi:hydroxymethylpyrimidine pyrophosphatase-like HAD family hydrolase